MRRAISKARAAFVIALGAACVLALIVLALWALFPQLARQAGERFEVAMRTRGALRAVTFVLCAALAALITLAVRRMTAAALPDPRETVSAVTLDDQGAVSLSANAMNALVSSAVGALDGVERYSATFAGSADALCITLNMIVKAGAAAPRLNDRTEAALTEIFANSAGITVSDVRLVVTGIAPAEA